MADSGPLNSEAAGLPPAAEPRGVRPPTESSTITGTPEVPPTLLRQLAIISAAALAMPIGVAAAQTASPGRVACAPDANLPADTTSLVLFLAPPDSIADSSRLERDRNAALVLADAFAPPPRLSLDQWAMATPDMIQYWSAGLAALWGLTATLDLHIDPHGHLLSIGLLDSARASELNAALLAAAHRADSARTFLASPPGGTDEVLLTLGGAPQPGPRDAPLMRVRVPYVHPDTPVSIRYEPAPEYPEVAQRGRVESSVELSFIVDERGRAVPSSVMVLHAEYKEFIVAAAHVVLHAEFQPARWGGCPIKQLVHQKINFRLRRR